MKNLIKVSTLVALVLALASVSASAQNSTTATIGLSATISSFDNITCTQSSGGINFGSSITQSGLTAAQAVNCSVTSNDTSAIDVTAYIPDAAPLTSGSDTIPNSDISWSATSGGTYASFAALSGSLSGNDGAIVASSVTIGDNTGVDFYLKLNVPAAQPAGDYSATMTVAITPQA